MEFIDLHISTKTRLTQIRTHASSLSGAINLMTAHKSKGLEFPHVFVIGAIDSAWGEKVRSRSRAIRYPANLQLQPAGATYDERLRLFFVAMTRAKTTLTMTYSQTNDSGSDTIIASFLTNCTPIIIPTSDDPAEQIELAETDWTTRLTSPIVPELKDFIGASAGNIQTFCDAFEQLPRRFTWRTAKFLIEQFATFSIRQKFRRSLRNRDSQQPPASTLLIQRRSSIAKHRTNPPIFPKITREPAFASGRFSIVLG